MNSAKHMIKNVLVDIARFTEKRSPMSALNVRPPINRPIPRQPGQYLDERLQDEKWEEGGTLLLIAGGALVMAATEWLRFTFGIEPHPVAVSGIALLAVWWAIHRLRKLKMKWKALSQGRDGERHVGQVLDTLIAQDATVIHDLPADRFNIDHVVIGPFGIWAVETKTISKPIGRKAVITYSDTGLVIDGGPVRTESIEQAVRQAAWLGRRIKELTGLTVPVRAAVIYPGWYIECAKPWSKPIWVMHEHAFASMVVRETCSLSDVDRRAIDYHLRQMAQVASHAVSK